MKKAMKIMLNEQRKRGYAPWKFGPCSAPPIPYPVGRELLLLGWQACSGPTKKGDLKPYAALLRIWTGVRASHSKRFTIFAFSRALVIPYVNC